MSKWCEACRDHFENDHYDQPWISPVDGEEYSDGKHGIGKDYGPYGVLLEKAQLWDELQAWWEKQVNG